jgi:hypothetical protein
MNGMMNIACLGEKNFNKASQNGQITAASFWFSGPSGGDRGRK